MAISRMQQPRQMYGLGSFVKKVTRKLTRPITKVAKKLVPKEIAGIMRVAAPFLPPGYREAAYLLGTAKQTGRISPVDLALTAAPTIANRFRYNPGQGISFAKGAEGMTLGESVRAKVPGGEGLMDFLVGGKQDAKIGRLDADVVKGPLTGSDIRSAASAQISPPMDTQGIFGKGGDFNLLKGSLLSKPEGGIKLGSAVALGTGALSLIASAKTPDEAGEALASATGNSDDYERGVQLFSQLTPELFAVPEQFRAKDGGRIGFDRGSPDPRLEPLIPPRPGPKRGLGGLGGLGDILDMQDFGNMIIVITNEGKFILPKNEDILTPNIFLEFDDLSKPKRNDRGIITINPDDLKDYDKMFRDLRQDPLNPRKPQRAGGGMMRTNYAIGSDDPKPLPNDPTEPVNPFKPKPIGPVLPDKKMASPDRYQKILEEIIREMESSLGRELTNAEYDLAGQLAFDKFNSPPDYAAGGRVNYALGTRPTAEESGLGGLPIEADMRYTGGFMPYGAKEKADDVPARLSKNEFVFTADAVRAAGGGSVNEGAKKMYATMKQLEKKPEAKGMMA
jgi:hypothetical protein